MAVIAAIHLSPHPNVIAVDAAPFLFEVAQSVELFRLFHRTLTRTITRPATATALCLKWSELPRCFRNAAA